MGFWEVNEVVLIQGDQDEWQVRNKKTHLLCSRCWIVKALDEDPAVKADQAHLEGEDQQGHWHVFDDLDRIQECLHRFNQKHLKQVFQVCVHDLFNGLDVETFAEVFEVVHGKKHTFLELTAMKVFLQLHQTRP